jgi:hypothetical protein
LPAEPTSDRHDQSVDPESAAVDGVAKHDLILAARLADPRHIEAGDAGDVGDDAAHGGGPVEQGEDLAVSLAQLE